MFQCPNCLRANHNDGLCNDCASARKGEGMDLVKTNCKTCGIPLLNSEVCYKCSERTAQRRALYREAYMAALGGACADPNVGSPDRDAHVIALESVRTHAARMQELERLIEEVANG